jgi:hypothetical protein
MIPKDIFIKKIWDKEYGGSWGVFLKKDDKVYLTLVYGSYQQCLNYIKQSEESLRTDYLDERWSCPDGVDFKKYYEVGWRDAS